MKKYIFGIVLGLLFVVSPVQAQTTQEQYVSALQQIIVLLTQQVNLLLQQLNTIQNNPPSSPVPVTVITPVAYPTSPVVGSTNPPQGDIIPPMTTPEVVKSITIEDNQSATAYITLSTIPQFVLRISYSEDGTKLANIPLTITTDKNVINIGAKQEKSWVKTTEKIQTGIVAGKAVYSNLVEFTFSPIDTQTPTDFLVTVSVNGVSAEKTFRLI